jgi:beta-galactosidase
MPAFTRRDLLRSGAVLSATSLLSCHTLHAEGLLAAYAGQDPSAHGAIAPRERFLLDFGWKFFQGSASNPAHDLGFGKNQGDFAKTGDFGFAESKFDDSKWRPLDLPHDWAVELPFVDDKALDGHGYKPLGRNYPETSVGWYRRSFDLPKEDAGRRITLDFDGVFRSSLVFLNGCFIGRNDNGYAPFRFDITDFVNPGEKNYLVVRVDASFGDGWFYEGAGIYRHVWLTKTDPVHLGAWDTYVRAEVGGSEALLSLGTVVFNRTGQPAPARVSWKVLDAANSVVASGDSPRQMVLVDGSASYTAQLRLPNPSLWSPETPHLYSLVSTVDIGGRICDAEHVNFGVRSIAFDADKGVFLNGRSVKIKGTCNHQDHAGVGAALPDRLQSFRVGVLKEMGSNAVRTSHNMPTPEWVEACDRMGMMMMCETRMMNSSPEGLAQLETMIKRYRNSPSIIIWSMGNEEWGLQTETIGAHIVATMVERSHELDPTRLCTAAVNGAFNKIYDQGAAKSLDVMGFNYNLNDIDAFRKAHPKLPLIGSETASAVSTRGIYITDKLRNWVSAYDVNHPPWAELAEEWWKFYAERDWLPGGFAWTGFDYRGEPTPYAWPSINSQFGIVDMCGFPKDTFFYYKSWWGSEPVLHLFPHWNWEERNGEPISVWVHSNLDEVELFHNGKSLGSHSLTWSGRSPTSPASSKRAAAAVARSCSPKSAKPPANPRPSASPPTAPGSMPTAKTSPSCASRR